MEETLVETTVRSFGQTYLYPSIQTSFREARFDVLHMKRMGEQGLFAIASHEPPKSSYQCPSFGYVSYGITAYTLESIDSAYRSVFSVQSSLVMQAIFRYGSESQKHRYLGRLARGERIGCFGLTEANHGSDPSGMETRATRLSDGKWRLNGSKSWITNAPIADIFVVWTKDASTGTILGFLLERGMSGITTSTIHGKYSLRASATGCIFLQDVIVSEEQRLPFAKGLMAPLSCLSTARYGISWGVLGAAMTCLKCTHEYVMDRRQFGNVLASYQLVQKKLVDMHSEIALGTLSAFRVGRLLEQGKGNAEMISLLKRRHCAKALEIARTCRELLGANGISDDYPVIRHLLNLEAVSTYEGTEDIHTLILGRAMTGISAFHGSKTADSETS